MGLTAEQLAELEGTTPPKVEEDNTVHDMAGIARRLLQGVTLGGSEALAERTDDYYPPDETWKGDLAEIGGSVLLGFGAGAAFRGPRTAALATNVARANPRLARLFLGAGENAAIGGTAEAIQGGDAGDIATRAAAEGAIGGAMDGAINGIGWLYSQGLRKIGGPKNTTRIDPTIADPFSDPGVSTYDGMHRGLVNIAEREGVPVLPQAVNPHRGATKFLYMKGAQSSAVQPYLQELDATLDDAFQQWGSRIVEQVSPVEMRLPRKTGEAVQTGFETHLEDIRGKAGELYETVIEGIEQGPFNAMDTAPVVSRLRSLVEEEGFSNVPDVYANKIRALAGRLEGRDAIGFQELWNEAKKLYPRGRGGDPAGRRLAQQAFRLLKGELRNHAGNVDPIAESLFRKGDVYWGKAADLAESDVGEILLTKDPEVIVDRLTQNVSWLRRTREVLGQDVTNALAQRRLALLFSDSIGKDGQLDATRFLSNVKSLGGQKKHGNVGGEYFDELLRDNPEVRSAIDDFAGLLSSYEMPRNVMAPRYEQVGGGVETSGLSRILTNMEAALLTITHFASGGALGKTLADTNPRTNPLLGGTRPPLDEKHTIASIHRMIRRMAAIGGVGGVAEGVADRILTGKKEEDESTE